MSALAKGSRFLRFTRQVFAPRRFTHDSFAALNVYKDPAEAPVEKVCFDGQRLVTEILP